MNDADRSCEICGTSAGLNAYGVHVDGAALALSPVLCNEHGARFLLRTGMVIASLSAPLERVFLSESCGFILSSCRCEFRKGHGGDHSFEQVLRSLTR